METITAGINVDVALEALIERIYIAPKAPNWLADLLRVVIKQYGYSFEVMHSRIDEQALF